MFETFKYFDIIVMIFKEEGHMAKAENRLLVTLVCTDCKSKNYTVSKNKKNTPSRLELNKYCSTCKKATAHKEQK